jgi:hypothetical protein
MILPVWIVRERVDSSQRKSEKTVAMQTLLRKNDAVDAQPALSPQLRFMLAAIFGLSGVLWLTGKRDIPLGLLSVLLAIVHLSTGLKFVPERWPWPAGVGMFFFLAVAGVAEMRDGRTWEAWVFWSAAIVGAAIFLVARLRPSRRPPVVG